MVEEPKSDGKSDAIPNVEFEDDRFDADFSNDRQNNYSCIERMLLNLALNHAVMMERPSSDDQKVGLL